MRESARDFERKAAMSEPPSPGTFENLTQIKTTRSAGCFFTRDAGDPEPRAQPILQH
jgi:hypothetical protein